MLSFVSPLTHAVSLSVSLSLPKKTKTKIEDSCRKASPISQYCSLYLLCTEFSDSWSQQPQPWWFTTMVFDVLLPFFLYLISGFRDLDSLCLTCGFGDLDFVVKIWCSLHVLVLDFDFKCIWFLWIGKLNGYGGFDLSFIWICCLCCTATVILFS